MRYIFLILFLFSAIASLGQGKLSNPNLIYFEAGGNSHLVTLNYERMFPQKPKQSVGQAIGSLTKSVRIGMGILSNDLSIPLSLNLTKSFGTQGQKAGHNLLVSAGPTIYTKDFQNFKFDQVSDDSDTFLILNLGVGYRFTEPSSKFFFQGTINPHVDLDVTASSGTTNTGLDWSFGFAAGIRI